MCTYMSITYIFLGVPFPRNFLQVCKKILTRLYRVFVHVYIHHFDKLISIGAVSFTYMYMYMYMCSYNNY